MLNRPQEVAVRPPLRNSLYWLRPDIKRYHRKVSSSEDSDDNYKPTYKSPRVNTPITAVCSHQQHQYIARDDDKVSMPVEEEMNRNLKDLQWESDNNNSRKDRTDDGEDDFKELAQELNKEERLAEPEQQTFGNIFLRQFGKISNLMKK